ncbi:ABC transporter substrate-binding protein [Egibacter rhizosphaerae]|uniref:ABC transporter substrate-binding protein n=1 Tax=Egibacter rhizosphaerae TaxID=1670831 RepID=A0A411YKE3_9ACTN|nr:ABC transporter substrate-binding protein [Egibacter rhizosphaerae]QBI21665.1 ABC transporter substrate-binding protein [Egibacter rhizosphaerae]
MHSRSTLALLVGLLVIALAIAGCRQDEEAAEPADDEDPDDAAVDDEPDDDDEEPDDDEPEEEEEPDEEDEDPDDEDEEEAPEAPGAGVTEEPCPEDVAVNEDNGCIYLGSLNDLTVGAFAQAGPLIQDAMEAFWAEVNEDGGIGGYDVDIETHIRDNEYVPEVQAEVFEEIRGDILGLGVSLGSSPTIAIRDELEGDDMFAVPMAWNSDFPFDPVMLETGPNYCVDSMNAVDYYIENAEDVDTIMSVHYPNDYGQDSDVGVRHAAEAVGAEHIGVQTPDGEENQADAIAEIVSQDPDLVILTTNPTDAGALVGESVAQGYEGFFIGHGPTWNVALLDSPAGEAMENFYWSVGPYPTYESDTPGHQAMQDALGEAGEGEPRNNFHTAGWVSQYPIRDALEAAADEGEISRAAVMDAIHELDSVDYEGMLPEGSGNFAGEPNDRVVRASAMGEPDRESSSGLVNTEIEYEGPTAAEHDFDEPCRDSY